MFTAAGTLRIFPVRRRSGSEQTDSSGLINIGEMISALAYASKGQIKGRRYAPICAESGAIVVTSLLEPAPFIIHGVGTRGGRRRGGG